MVGAGRGNYGVRQTPDGGIVKGGSDMNEKEIREYRNGLARRLNVLGRRLSGVPGVDSSAEIALALWEIAALLAEANQLARMRIETELKFIAGVCVQLPTKGGPS